MKHNSHTKPHRLKILTLSMQSPGLGETAIKAQLLYKTCTGECVKKQSHEHAGNGGNLL